MRRLEAAVADLRGRLDALSGAVSAIEHELRDLNEAEDLGATQ